MTNEEKLKQVFPELIVNGKIIFPKSYIDPDKQPLACLLGADYIMREWLKEEYKEPRKDI